MRSPEVHSPEVRTILAAVDWITKSGETHAFRADIGNFNGEYPAYFVEQAASTVDLAQVDRFPGPTQGLYLGRRWRFDAATGDVLYPAGDFAVRNFVDPNTVYDSVPTREKDLVDVDRLRDLPPAQLSRMAATASALAVYYGVQLEIGA